MPKAMYTYPVLDSAVKILDAMYPPEEFVLMTAYGPLGFGKSAYALKVGVDVLLWWYRHTLFSAYDYRILEEYEEARRVAWELVKQFIIFHPEQFFHKLDEIEALGIRSPILIWDDAGLWLFALEYNDPFLIKVTKYFVVARTLLGSVFCTTPNPSYIINKLRNFPQSYNIGIIKTTGSKKGLDKYKRRGKAYLQYYNIIKGMRVSGPKYHDDFICLMPDDFYKWYKPLRDSYEKMARSLMKEEWEKQKAKSQVMSMEGYEDLQVPKLTLGLIK